MQYVCMYAAASIKKPKSHTHTYIRDKNQHEFIKQNRNKMWLKNPPPNQGFDDWFWSAIL